MKPGAITLLNNVIGAQIKLCHKDSHKIEIVQEQHQASPTILFGDLENYT